MNITQCTTGKSGCQQEANINKVNCVTMQSLYTKTSNNERVTQLHVFRPCVGMIFRKTLKVSVGKFKFSGFLNGY
jgi:hypothetical protein